jgi:hypothetical protein
MPPLAFAQSALRGLLTQISGLSSVLFAPQVPIVFQVKIARLVLLDKSLAQDSLDVPFAHLQQSLLLGMVLVVTALLPMLTFSLIHHTTRMVAELHALQKKASITAKF